MSASTPTAWWLLEQECHRLAADHRVLRKPKVGQVIEAATGAEKITKVYGNGLVIETKDKIGRSWERERAFAGHWTVIG